VRAVYLMILARQPTPAEQAAIAKLVNAGGPSAAKDVANDVAWALLTSSEFLFVQ
jgi:hypothetical protein